ncbi:MAG: thiamine pyrophosphate-binding protein [Acidimicrobiia bacterium]|nr:thiamine pyrophosphate-binding protein [Acidimicrobiia bacterium]
MADSNGGSIIADILAAEGTTKVFGIPDGTYLAMLNALVARNIEVVTPRHETTAMHMAAAYARLRGDLGVAIASNGPGVANALPGIAVENAEGNRVLVITSSRRVGITYPDRGGTYQYFDQVAAIDPISKWSASVPSVDRLPDLLRTALRWCYRGRPGVVHLDVPESIINGKAKPASVVPPQRTRRTSAMTPDPDLVDRAASMLANATLPAIHAGGGVIHARAHDELTRVAEMLHAPVTTSWSGRGAMSESSPLVWPITAIEPTNEVRNVADVMLVLGSRVGETDWWGKSPNWRNPAEQKVIQVDIDDASLALNKPTDLALLGDVGLFLQELAKRLEASGITVPAARRTEVQRLIEVRAKDAAKRDKPLRDMDAPMVTAHVPKVCQEVFAEDAIVIADGGNTAVWTNFHHQIRVPNTMLGTPHFGMLGAGVGQALGAAEAFPDRQVYCIIGDGAFGMHPQEIETAVRNGNRIVFLVVSDRQWGMVKMTQSVAKAPVKMMIRKSLEPGATVNSDLGEIGYDQLARSMGAHGERVSSPHDLRPAIDRSIDSGICAVIHVDVDPVKHMWAPGLLQFKKMHQEPGG